MKKTDLEKCLREREEYLNGWKKERADFINYKKAEKERMEAFLKFSSENLIVRLLPILDSFSRAKESLNPNSKEIAGLIQIEKQFMNFLKSEGVEEIKVKGKKFNPVTAEALEQSKSKKYKPGIVTKVIRKGYKLKGKVIRPAQVKISK